MKMESFFNGKLSGTRYWIEKLTRTIISIQWCKIDTSPVWKKEIVYFLFIWALHFIRSPKSISMDPQNGSKTREERHSDYTQEGYLVPPQNISRQHRLQKSMKMRNKTMQIIFCYNLYLNIKSNIIPSTLIPWKTQRDSLFSLQLDYFCHKWASLYHITTTQYIYTNSISTHHLQFVPLHLSFSLFFLSCPMQFFYSVG